MFHMEAPIFTTWVLSCLMHKLLQSFLPLNKYPQKCLYNIKITMYEESKYFWEARPNSHAIIRLFQELILGNLIFSRFSKGFLTQKKRENNLVHIVWNKQDNKEKRVVSEWHKNKHFPRQIMLKLLVTPSVDFCFLSCMKLY